MADEIYEVERLLQARGSGKTAQYLVKWEGYTRCASSARWRPRPARVLLRPRVRSLVDRGAPYGE